MVQDFPASQRFEPRRRLGAGSFGVVYEAFDRERQLAVALKVLRSGNADALLLFKREFRALADLNHRNLVTLYELLAEGPQWFFTMELLKGRPFTSHAWDLPESALAPIEPDAEEETYARTVGASGSSPTPVSPLEASPAEPDAPVERHPVDYTRLRGMLAQLAGGLNALHGAGMLHRDIKPSNVLVTADGRVVLLDFGLVAYLGAPGADPAARARVVGTPAYMSPEQAAGQAASPASDWYGVGVMLYEALTSRVPFTGSMADVLAAKQTQHAPPVGAACPDAPDDLAALARDLLARDPARRPTGQEILARLAGGGAARALGPAADPRAASAFVGRTRELAGLADAFAAMSEGQTVVAHVHGISGMGKTTLVRRFLQDLRARERDVVVLAGRCYQQESVPYKALDPLVDELSQWMGALEPATVEALLPRDVPALVRLFPVLGRLEAARRGGRRRPAEAPDIQELRRRADAAFRELLARIAERWPTVLFIDDLQWSDLDSTRLIGELLQPPDPPRLLLIGTYRSDEAETSPALRELLALHASGQVAADRREVALRELGPDDIRTIVASTAGAEPVLSAVADRVYCESGGNPFFAHALARLAVSRPAAIATGDITLESAIAARLAEVPDAAVRLLQVLALAGRPVPIRVALQAADLGEGDYALLAAARAAQLVRARETDRAEEVELYHDRIREVVSRRVPAPDAERLHGRLAAALEEAGGADPESLALHCSLAGDTRRAAGHAMVAADGAAEALAFDRAARLYAWALQLAPEDAAAPVLRLKRAEALANAGRGAEAARAYLEAAGGAGRTRAIELQRHAAEQFLISGHIDEGRRALDEVLRPLGMRLARTPQRALLRLVLRRLLIRVRGLRFRERPASAVSAADLLRIDLCWSVAIGLAFVDNMRAGDFQQRHCLLALRSGEPYRIARALALEAGYSATGGTRTARRTAAVARAAAGLAERLQNPHAIGLASLTAGIAAHLEGRWRESLELCERADRTFGESCTGVTWERDTAALHILENLWSLGDLPAMADRIYPLIGHARARGDLYGETSLQLRNLYLLPLMRDEPDEAWEGIESAEAVWPRDEFLLQHYWGLMARLDVLAYQGRGGEALDLLARQWRKLAAAQLLRVQFSTVESCYRRGRSGLMLAFEQAAGSRRRAELLARVERDARRLIREGAAWSAGFGHLLRAGAAHAEGRDDEACRELVASEHHVGRAEMRLCVATCRHLRGRLLGGDEGRRLMAEGDDAYRARRVACPDRFHRLVAGWGE